MSGEPVRIAVDATALWGQQRYSGVEKVVDRVVHRLVASPRGCRFRVFVPRDWAGFEEDLPHQDENLVELVKLPFSGSRRLVRIAWQQVIFPFHLRASNLVISPVYVMPILTPATCPALVFVHDLHGLDRHQTRPANYLHYRLALPPTLRRAAAVLTPTRTVLEQVLPSLSPGCYRAVAPLGIDRCFSPGESGCFPETPHSPRPGLARPYLLFVGNLEERKGLRLLLEAFARLQENQPSLDLVLVGKDYGLRPTLQALVDRLRLTGRVHFAGFVTPENLVELYRRATLLVHPALSEGFGLPPLEAMACGTPVVAVRSPAVCENLGMAAFFTDPDAASLASGIARILDSPAERQALVLAGLALAGRFTWERTTECFWEAIGRETATGTAGQEWNRG